MKYNKGSTKKRIKRANSLRTKIKNKLGLTGLQIGLIAFAIIFAIGCAAALGIAKGIIDSAPDISKIDVQLKAATQSESAVTVTQTGIIAIAWDRDALGVRHMERRTSSIWEPSAEFWNVWYKVDASYFCDTNENAVVFIAADD